MSQQLGMFEVQAPPTPSMTAAERRRARVLTCVQSGSHPLALVLGATHSLALHTEAVRDVPATTGPTCGSCTFRRPWGGVAGSYPKWLVDGTARASHGEATDVRASWPACRLWAAPVTGHRFEAVWPVLHVEDLADPQALLDQAVDDLPRLAAQARADLLGPARLAIRRGRDVPGSGGATWVVHAVVTAAPMPARPYWRNTA